MVDGDSEEKVLRSGEEIDLDYLVFLNADFNRIVKTLELTKSYGVEVPSIKCLQNPQLQKTAAKIIDARLEKDCNVTLVRYLSEKLQAVLEERELTFTQ